jgi:tRNA modification GTPase
VLFNLGDTAGLRETNDPIEKEGVRRAEDKLQKSDVIVVLLDNSRALQAGEARLVGKLVEVVEARGVKCVVALNKIDLTPIDEERFSEIKDVLSRHRVVCVSAKTLVGLDALKEALVSAAISDSENIADSSVMITNMRHFSALERAKTSLLLALETLKAGKTGEFVAVDLRGALDSIGEIVGTVTTEDILNTIFSKFCIGK